MLHNLKYHIRSSAKLGEGEGSLTAECCTGCGHDHRLEKNAAFFSSPPPERLWRKKGLNRCLAHCSVACCLWLSDQR